MSRWPRVPIGDVLKPRNEIVHPRDHPTGNGTFVGLEHVESGTGRRVGSQQIDLARLTGRKAHFRTGDIVYGYLRPYLNKVWVAEFDGYCSVDQYVFSVDSAADPRYVAAYLRSPEFLGLAPVHGSPGQLPRIRTEEVLSVPIPLPEISRQRAIVARLTEEMASVRRAAISSMGRGSQIAALRKFALNQAFAEESKRAPSLPIRGVARIQTGYAFKSSWFRPTGTRLLRNTNIGHGAIDWTDTARLDSSLESNFTSFQLRSGDIVLSLDRPLVSGGIKVARIEDRDTPALLLQRVARFILGPNVTAEYLYRFLFTDSFIAAITGHDQSLGIPHASPRQVGGALIPIPPVERQRRLAAELEERLVTIDAMAKSVDAEFEAIQAIPAALLRRAFAEHEAA